MDYSTGKKSRTYRKWGSMIQRCTNPKHGAFKYYGGRGITVAACWLDYATFLRDIDGPYAASMLAAAGVSGTVTRSTNHNADAAVASGQASAASYVGIPHVAK